MTDILIARAQGSAIARAAGEAKAIETVFQAVHDGRQDPQLRSYQHLAMLPRLAQGEVKTVFPIPPEPPQAFGGFLRALEPVGCIADPAAQAVPRPTAATRSGTETDVG